LLAGVEGVCRKESDEAASGRASEPEVRSGVVAPLRDAAGVRAGCEPGLADVAFPDFFSAVFVVDGVLTLIADVVVLPDVALTLAGSVSFLLSPLLSLLEVGAGTSISCTSAGVLALDLTALLPFIDDGLDAESTDVLLEDNDGATFICRPDPGLTGLAASFVRLTVD